MSGTVLTLIIWFQVYMYSNSLPQYWPESSGPWCTLSSLHPGRTVAWTSRLRTSLSFMIVNHKCCLQMHLKIQEKLLLKISQTKSPISWFILTKNFLKRDRMFQCKAQGPLHSKSSLHGTKYIFFIKKVIYLWRTRHILVRTFSSCRFHRESFWPALGRRGQQQSGHPDK